MEKLIAALVLALAVASPVSAKVTATASVAIDNPAPTYGDVVTLTVTTDGAPTDLNVTCTHAFGQSYGFSVIHNDSPWSMSMGLYAPNWPSGGATCVANVQLYVSHGRYNYKTTVIGSLAFTVAP